MEAQNWLLLFLETGAPEYYLLYKEAVRCVQEKPV